MQGDTFKGEMLTAYDADTLGVCTVMLSLTAGEEVYVQIVGGMGNNNHNNHFNMFTGHLVNIHIWSLTYFYNIPSLAICEQYHW